MPLEGLRLVVILLLIEVKLNDIFSSPSFIYPDVPTSSETFVHYFKELGGNFFSILKHKTIPLVNHSFYLGLKKLK